MFQGKKLSILGDSISSYAGISDDGMANATLYENPCFYGKRFPVENTYWMQLMKDMGMTLCVNNSWSGGNLSGRDQPHAGVNRAYHLSRDDGQQPDFIIVFMGLNDLGRKVPVDVFAADYQRTLEIIKERHPQAWVCCVNLPDREPFFLKRATAFNEAIAEAAKAVGDKVFVADLFHTRLNNDFYYDNTVDGLHPDKDGMRYIADVIEGAILMNT